MQETQTDDPMLEPATHDVGCQTEDLNLVQAEAVVLPPVLSAAKQEADARGETGEQSGRPAETMTKPALYLPLILSDSLHSFVWQPATLNPKP